MWSVSTSTEYWFCWRRQNPLSLCHPRLSEATPGVPRRMCLATRPYPPAFARGQNHGTTPAPLGPRRRGRDGGGALSDTGAGAGQAGHRAGGGARGASDLRPGFRFPTLGRLPPPLRLPRLNHDTTARGRAAAGRAAELVVVAAIKERRRYRAEGGKLRGCLRELLVRPQRPVRGMVTMG